MHRSYPTTPRAKAVLLSLLTTACIFVYFFAILDMARAPDKQHSIAYWAMSNWLHHPHFLHGLLIFPSLGAMLFLKRKLIIDTLLHPSPSEPKQNLPILLMVLGGLIYLIAFRTLQPRLAMASLPILLWSSIWFLAGWRLAKTLAFPCFFIWVVIPVPSFQYATVGLQDIAIQMAKFLSSLLGVETLVQGTNIYAKDGSWGPFSVTGGCSGIRSLTGLFMLACTYAYITQLKLWKFVAFVLSTIPIAIIGNAFRASSICIMADYVSPSFASSTWHDWSGVAIFTPISVLCLILFYRILEQKSFRELISFHRPQTITRRNLQ